MRTRADPNTDKWEHVPTRAKNQIWAEVLSNFTKVRLIHRPAVEAQAGVTFRKQKSQMKGLIKAYKTSGEPGLCPKPLNVESQEQREEYMRSADEPYSLERSAQNSINRSKSKFVSKQGRTPMSGYRWTIEQNPLDDPLGRDPIEIWRDRHNDAEGRFVNEEARQAYEKLLASKARIAPNERATHEEDRRDYLVGLGPTQSQSQSQSRQSMSSQQSEDSTSSRPPMQESIVIKSLKKSQKQLREHSVKISDAYTTLFTSLKSHYPNIEAPAIPELPVIPELGEDGLDGDDGLDEDANQ